MVIAAILMADHDAAIDGLPIALLPWRDDETLIEYEVAQMQAAGVDVIVVVLGFEAERIIPLVARDGVEPIVNDRWRDGAAGSMRVGATAVPRDTDTAVLVSVAEPRSSDVYRALINEHARADADIARSSYNGVASTPVVVGHAALAQLRNTTDHGGVDAVLARYADEIAEVAFDERALVRIVSEDDYVRARARGGLE
jgi:CTP:molybdopterin cytidylyltransferase MocA